jgi:hypothetical protein
MVCPLLTQSGRFKENIKLLSFEVHIAPILIGALAIRPDKKIQSWAREQKRAAN